MVQTIHTKQVTIQHAGVLNSYDILKEYYHLFVQPTIFYLKEYFRVTFSANIELGERILESLNFRKCTHCYKEGYEKEDSHSGAKKKYLIERFGNFEFPIEPTKFYFKGIEEGRQVAFFYSRVFRCLDDDFFEDESGLYKRYMVEFINHENRFVYLNTKIYEKELPKVQLFRHYLTKVEEKLDTRQAFLTTYAIEP